MEQCGRHLCIAGASCLFAEGEVGPDQVVGALKWLADQGE